MTRKKRPLLERLMEKVRVEPSGCWVWTASKYRDGYGWLHGGDGRTNRAHRLSYEEHVGPIPDGLHLDHLCRNHACVNPSHLEPVTAKVNILRGVGHAAVNAAKVECVNGHPLDESSHKPWASATRRRCPVCHRERMRSYRTKSVGR